MDDREGAVNGRATQHSQQYVAGLLDRTFGIWLMQLPRYAELVMLTNGREDYLVPMRRIDDPALVTFTPRNNVSLTIINRPGLYGSGWEELVHPLGGTYYYHTNKASTGRLYKQWLEDFIDVSRATAKEDEWVLVVHQMTYRGEDDLNGYLLFRECIQASEWRHKRLELEAQYWRHVEFFPHKFHMTSSQVRHACREILCYLGEATTLNQSTAATIFWTIDQIRQVDAQLASVEIEALAENGVIEDTGIVLCCRILYMLRILPTKEDDDADRHYKYTDLLLHTKVNQL
ncbi:uncharacterized protein F5891DRAFT_982615 [Suillus fuscotomentosus]|uniref:Uncharacterized protein n=1 Tax=Suillus fuscotomentosus TaxID=1912939 RepID=A0AAD4E0E8_9AGAM|nr:uncharacterized protein F5891DRAFT_982615 [Suillus fuscotomentosus]KAG1897429.1 hypothetical protein F5891DRAFT_982615 [Suillus fuscotomentosus]